ncbi:septum formation initiator family protein [Demequina sp. NBRC 110055]|uniref:FtsB family cell division protein n=1 Tax=Demequina sp. NBRC 110055 TaxID=1570344 RepID=UPI00118539F9|nr:septum formation initiator family protein [Demequina sp. NBRC 110055]
MLTWRTAIIVFVAILAFAVVWPTARAYLEQQNMLDGLRADAAAAQAEVDDLTADVARWDDDAYIEAQARERLTYVYPGETAYRVLDPETLEAVGAEDEASAEEAVAQGDTWYDALWNSVEVAGEVDRKAPAVSEKSDATHAPDDAPADDN